MAICPSCGAEIADSAKFCTECGFRQPERETKLEDGGSSLPPLSASDGNGKVPDPFTVRPASSAAAAAWDPERTHGTNTRMRRIGALAILLVFLAAAAFFAFRNAKNSSPGVHTQNESSETAAPAPAAIPGLSGYYTLSAYSLGEREYDKNALKETGYESWYLIFNDDGTGYACILDQPALPFTCSGDKLLLEDGNRLSYSAQGDTVTVYSGATLIFTRSSAQAPEVDAAPDASGQIPLDSFWHGELEISNHKGTGTLENKRFEVWGVIGETASGEQYFELYDVPEFSADDEPILSMWVQLDGDRLVPVIGDEDAWLLDMWLLPSDKKAFTLYLNDDTLSCKYHYVLEKESCDVYFLISPLQ